jgi:hypothetical protein
MVAVREVRRLSDLDLLREGLARIVAARESLEFGDAGEAAQILYELEVDLAGATQQEERA